MVTAVTHATRDVPDLDVAVAFYRDLIGFQVVNDDPMNVGPGRTACWLSLSLPDQPNFEPVRQDSSQCVDGEAVPGMAAQP